MDWQTGNWLLKPRYIIIFLIMEFDKNFLEKLLANLKHKEN
jgi:hypothetical protein